MNECPFCLTNSLLNTNILYENEQVYAIDTYGVEGANTVLIITKRHVESAFDISADEWNAIHSLLPLCKAYLDDREPAQGYNIGWNVFAVGGQTVPHAHLHVAARYDNEEQAGRGIRYHFKAVRNKRKSSR